ncbi:hypothetical protein D0U04_22495 [Bacillus clarus]|uniref:Putative lipoprotein n=1 Tax=Bacillus clarus TaxID=2338372 RepID=A0A090YUG6_9BACI|nr:hypothetical protein [Bacillus clarus]KFM95730.1 putative lipoprotein [Bacillus clarus]RFT64336.1 hypothetical protein D0U04_22495 [Bacillus clarus]
MKKIVVIIASIFTLVISGCNSIENPVPAIHTKDLSNIPFEYGWYYKETSKQAGFTSDQEPDIYNTYWFVKIYKLYDLEIQNKEEIKKWLKDYNIIQRLNSNNSDALNDEQINLTLEYINLCNELDVKISKSTEKELLSKFKKLENTVQTKNGSIKFNPSLIKLSTILKQEIPNKEGVIFTLKELLEENPTSKIYYTYLLMFLDEKIEQDSIKNLEINSKLNSEEKKLKIETLNDLYYLKTIYTYYDIDFAHKISEEDITNVITSYINNDPQLSAQFLYKTLFITSLKAPNKHLDDLFEYLNSTRLKNGWINPAKLIDINSTYYGLLIGKYYSTLNNLNKQKINNYLTTTFEELKKTWDKNYVYLNPLLDSVLILENNDFKKECQIFITQKVNEEVQKTDPNSRILMELIKASFSLNIQKQFKENFSNDIQEKLYNNLQQTTTNEQSIYEFYPEILLDDFFNNESSKQKHLTELNQYKNNKSNGYSDQVGQIDSVDATIAALTSLQHSNHTSEDTLKYLKKHLTTEIAQTNPNFIQIGKIIRGINLIEQKKTKLIWFFLF